MDKIEIKDIYSALSQLTIHAEDVAWNRFSSFMTANSILILAWFSLYSVEIPIKYIKLALAVLAFLGLLISVGFSFLGFRGRAFLREYLKIGSVIESDPACWPTDINAYYKPFSNTTSTRDSLSFGIFGGRNILVGGSMLFGFFYIFLLILSFLYSAPILSNTLK